MADPIKTHDPRARFQHPITRGRLFSLMESLLQRGAPPPARPHRPTPHIPPPRLPQDRFPVPVVDAQLCTGCGDCKQVCGAEAIQIDEVAVIDSELCISCEACLRDCPEQAISLPPDGAAG